MAFNVNSPDTDLVDLGGIVFDLNQLEIARLVENGSYCLLFLKNGHSHVISVGKYEKLRDYCRQS